MKIFLITIMILTLIIMLFSSFNQWIKADNNLSGEEVVKLKRILHLKIVVCLALMITIMIKLVYY